MTRITVPDRRSAAPIIREHDHFQTLHPLTDSFEPAGEAWHIGPEAICEFGEGECEESRLGLLVATKGLGHWAGFPEEEIEAQARGPAGEILSNSFESRTELLDWSLVEIIKNLHEHVLQKDTTCPVAIEVIPVTRYHHRGILIVAQDCGTGISLPDLFARNRAHRELLNGGPSSEIRGLFFPFLLNLARQDGVVVQIESRGRGVKMSAGSREIGVSTRSAGTSVSLLLLTPSPLEAA